MIDIPPIWRCGDRLIRCLLYEHPVHRSFSIGLDGRSIDDIAMHATLLVCNRHRKGVKKRDLHNSLLNCEFSCLRKNCLWRMLSPTLRWTRRNLIWINFFLSVGMSSCSWNCDSQFPGHESILEISSTSTLLFVTVIRNLGRALRGTFCAQVTSFAKTSRNWIEEGRYKQLSWS